MATTTHVLPSKPCTAQVHKVGLRRSILAPVRLVCGYGDGAGVRWSTTTTAPGSVQGAEQVW